MKKNVYCVRCRAKVDAEGEIEDIQVKGNTRKMFRGTHKAADGTAHSVTQFVASK